MAGTPRTNKAPIKLHLKKRQIIMEAIITKISNFLFGDNKNVTYKHFN